MRQAIEAMQEIGRTVTDVNTLATGVAVAIEEREAATGELRRGVAQAADGTSTVTDNMADVSTAPRSPGGSPRRSPTSSIGFAPLDRWA